MDNVIELLKDIVAALEKFIAAVEAKEAADEPVDEPTVEEPVVEPVIEPTDSPNTEPIEESDSENTEMAQEPVETIQPTPVNLDLIVDEIVDGKWGSGQTRKEKLEAAGYDYDLVQNRVNEILKVVQEVLDRKWSNGDERKQRLEAAGYNYDVIQKIINKTVVDAKTISDKILNACKVQAEWMKNYTYSWPKWNPKDVATSKKYGTCVTFVACVLQRLGYLKSGKYIWHNGKGYGTGKVSGVPSSMLTLYMNNKTLADLKANIKPGDVCLVDDNKSGEEGSGGHIFILTGKWDSNGNPIVWDNHSCDRIRNGKSGQYGYSKNRKVLALVRVKPANKKSVAEVAKEVLAGDWSSGECRKINLINAGYDYEAVQAKVNELLSKK